MYGKSDSNIQAKKDYLSVTVLALACDVTAKGNVTTFIGDDFKQRCADSATLRLLTQGSGWSAECRWRDRKLSVGGKEFKDLRIDILLSDDMAAVLIYRVTLSRPRPHYLPTCSRLGSPSILNYLASP